MSNDMNAPHIIRLAGPWKRTILAGEVPDLADPETTIRMPIGIAMDIGPDFQGRVEYRRFFNRPTGLDPSTRLLLALDRVTAMDLEVCLNEEQLGLHANIDGRITFDIRNRLRPRNELCVRLSTTQAGGDSTVQEPATCGLVGEVRLEIG